MTPVSMIALLEKWKAEFRQSGAAFIKITEPEADGIIGLLRQYDAMCHSSPCIHEWYHGSCVHCNADAPGK